MQEARERQNPLQNATINTLAPAECGRRQGVHVAFRRTALVLNKAEYLVEYEKNTPTIRQTRYLKKVNAPVE